VKLWILLPVIVLAGCSSAGIFDLQKSGKKVTQAPTTIWIEPFSIRPGAMKLGNRTAAEKRALGEEISRNLASRTSKEVQRYAANAAVSHRGRSQAPGTWLVSGEIVRLDQGSRALRAGVGLGMGATDLQTRVRVTAIHANGRTKILTFQTRGRSGLEPGAALGVATGGASLVGTGAGLVGGSLPGISSDIDRTAFETAAVLSDLLARNGLLDPSRQALAPRMTGTTPTSFNARRAVPAPVRDRVAP